MKTTRVRFTSGELSLEGMLSMPEGSGPFRAAIICHPHPLFGGSMDNIVVNSLFDALTRASVISFKFNFRGVGHSEGTFSQGVGEQEDVTAAISFVASIKEVDPQRIALIGYSAGVGFGFPVGAKDDRIKALVAISPPLDMFDFGFFRNCSKPKQLLSGDDDEFTTPSRFLEFCHTIPPPKEYEIIEGADHFWGGYQDLVAAKVVRFLGSAL